jgi:hypothetical protein
VIRVPDAPPGRQTAARRHRATNGRHNALHRTCRDPAEPARSDRRLTAGIGRVGLPPAPSRHELTPVADEGPPWWDARRLPGREAA